MGLVGYYMNFDSIDKQFKNIEPLIGNTPLAEIVFKYKGSFRKIYSKMEYYNITGSIKDRIAFHMLHKAYLDGNIKPGYRLFFYCIHFTKRGIKNQ
jgi:cysteine synthase A